MNGAQIKQVLAPSTIFISMTLNSSDDVFQEYLNSDDALFHYRKRNIAIKNILNENCFKLFKLNSTNDPQEYKSKLLGASTHIQNDNIAIEVLCAVDHLTRNSYFGSFCVNKNKSMAPEFGYKRSRMWSQYGENHFGVCIVLSKKKVINEINEICKKKYCLFDGDIKYKNINNQAMYINVVSEDNMNKSAFEIALEHVKKNYKELFFRKNIDYRDENEYRFLICNSSLDNTIYDESLSIKTQKIIQGVILGDRFPKEHKITIEKICRNLNVGIKKITWQKNDYFLI